MKFYNREKELAMLREIRERSFENHSQFTVITGRRRIGKTKLMTLSCEGTPSNTIYKRLNVLPQFNTMECCPRVCTLILRNLKYIILLKKCVFTD